MKNKILVLLFLTSSVLLLKAGPPVEDGKAIFTTRCAGCHNVNKLVTGPALAKVHERHSMEWIVNFVHSSQTMVKNGDKDAVALFEKFNKIPMPDHPDLSADNIKSIVEYIKAETKEESDKAPFVAPYQARPNYTPLSISNYGFFLGYFALVALLIVSLLFAVQVKSLQRNKKA